MALLIKHTLDFIFALILIIITSPLLLIFSILIKLEDGGKVFFEQERVGRDRTIFKIIKFRSMVENAIKMEGGFRTHEKDSRITKIGHFLRKTSLDELPQLFNILKGDMSFIGPRPPLPYFPKDYREYEDWVLDRFKMRPGMTGLAQVNGRNEIDWYKRFEYDVAYCRNWQLKNDVQMFVDTIKILFKQEGIYRNK